MMSAPEILPWHRRHPVHVVSELPEEREDVEIVLRLVHEIVSGFLFSDESPQPAKVLTIVVGIIAMRLIRLLLMRYRLCLMRLPLERRR